MLEYSTVTPWKDTANAASSRLCWTVPVPVSTVGGSCLLGYLVDLHARTSSLTLTLSLSLLYYVRMQGTLVLMLELVLSEYVGRAFI
jgi:hypothetical protein